MFAGTLNDLRSRLNTCGKNYETNNYIILINKQVFNKKNMFLFFNIKKKCEKTIIFYVVIEAVIAKMTPIITYYKNFLKAIL